MVKADKNKIEDRVMNVLKEFGNNLKSTNPLFRYKVSKDTFHIEPKQNEKDSIVGMMLLCDVSKKEPLFTKLQKNNLFLKILYKKEPILLIVYGFKEQEEKNFLYIKYSDDKYYPEIKKIVDSYLGKYSKLLENSTITEVHKFKKR